MVVVRIKEVAESRGIKTAYQLQKMTGAYPATAAKWFRNEVQSLSLDALNLLCSVLQCEPGDILEYTPDEAT